MKFGLQIPSFSWPGGTPAIAATLGRVVETADAVGFDSIWVMDHFFQIRSVGRPEEPMLEGLTALGWMAAHSRQARLGLMVGGIHYRLAPLWVKAVTTLDVLSGGRAWLGIGAAWNQEESEGLGFPFPPLAERFEQLEETLQYALAMWSGELGTNEPFDGAHIIARRLLNSPQAISRPHPPIMIGGGGERKTLRLVAQYGDATNVFGGPAKIAHKYAVLREHCERLGRDYEAIERSCLQTVRLTPNASGVVETAEVVRARFLALAEAGAQHIIFNVVDVWQPGIIERIGREIMEPLRTRSDDPAPGPEPSGDKIPPGSIGPSVVR